MLKFANINPLETCVNTEPNLKRKHSTMQYTVMIEKDPKTGTYTGQCIQIPAAISQGDTYEELMENIKDAINMVLQYYREKAAAESRGRRVFYRKLELA